MNKVAIECGGPIEGTFEFTVDGPGAYEVRGGHGAGKSTTLAGMELISGHKVDLTINDGALAGRVSGFGRVCPIGKRAKGTLEMETVDSSRFRMEDLIRPDGKTPQTRDSQRLKALAAMTGLELTPPDFGLSADDVDPSTDPVLLASRAKAHFDKRAKRLEEEADKVTGQAKVKLAIVEGVDLAAESDANTLVNCFDASSRALTEAEEKCKAVKSAKEAAKEAKTKLDQIDDTGDTADQLKSQLELVSANVKEVDEKIRQLQETHGKLVKDEEHLQSTLEKRQEKDRQIEELRQIVEHSVDNAPDEERIAELRDSKQSANRDMEYGVKVRDALKARNEAQELTAEADSLSARAEHLRDEAKAVFDTLAKRLKLHTMRVDSVDGHLRLLVKHDKREKPVTVDEHHGGLSGGERVEAILRELVHRLGGKGKPGLVVVDQTSWQELSQEVRQDIGRYAEEHNLYVWGAQITKGPLEVVKL